MAEEPLGELRVRASAAQAQRLLAWAAGWPERTWAIEGAAGPGHLLAQQLLAAGERVLDVQPKLGARVRLLATLSTPAPAVGQFVDQAGAQTFALAERWNERVRLVDPG